jgi:dienelactone hydrolase
MSGEWVEYDASGKAMRGCLVRARGEVKGAVLVVPEAPGLGPMPQRRANLLADLGYDAFVVDLYGNAAFSGYGEIARTFMESLTSVPGLLLERVKTGLEVLKRLAPAPTERRFAIGYCIGGTGVLELARSGGEVAGVVSFHGFLATDAPASPGTAMPRILACTGGADPVVPIEQVVAFRAEMEAAEADYQLLMLGSGVGHGFTNPDIVGERARPGFGFDALGDARAWRAMRQFLGDPAG